LVTWTNKHWGAVIGVLLVFFIAFIGWGPTALAVRLAGIDSSLVRLTTLGDDRPDDLHAHRRSLMVNNDVVRSVAVQAAPSQAGAEGGSVQEPARRATSATIAASSAGFDHIGQWLVGRSTHDRSSSSGMPARNDHSGCSRASER